MSRFTLTPHAAGDLDPITAYLQSIPAAPALRIGRNLRNALALIAERPEIGSVDSGLTRLSSRIIHRFVAHPYLI